MKRNTLVGGGGLVLLLLVASTLSAAPITDLNSTGVDLIDQVDQNWTIVTNAVCPVAATQCGGGNAYSPIDQVGISPGPGFEGPFWNVVGVGVGLPNWLVPGLRTDDTVDETTPGGGDFIQFGNGIWAYETTFTLPAFSTASISGVWWADGFLNFAGGGSDGLGGADCGIFLNGTCAGVPNSLVLPPGSYAGPLGDANAAGNPFSISSGFAEGTNTLRFVVRSGNDEVGLRVSLSGTYEDPINGEIPEPATYALMGAGLAVVALMRRRRA